MDLALNEWDNSLRSRSQIVDALVRLAYAQPRKPMTRGGRVAVYAMIKSSIESGMDPSDLGDMIVEDGLTNGIVWTLDGLSYAYSRFYKTHKASRGRTLMDMYHEMGDILGQPTRPTTAIRRELTP